MDDDIEQEPTETARNVAITPGYVHVKSSLEKMVPACLSKMEDVSTAVQGIITFAEDLQKEGHMTDDKLDELKQMVEDMLQTQQRLEAHALSIGDAVQFTDHANANKSPLPANWAEFLQQQREKHIIDPAVVREHQKRLKKHIEHLQEKAQGKVSEEKEDNDADLVVEKAEETFMCPLTKKLLEKPVRSKACGHRFSRAAIENLFKDYRANVIPCPVATCGRNIEKNGLQRDVEAEAEIRRRQRAPQPSQEEEDLVDVSQPRV